LQSNPRHLRSGVGQILVKQDDVRMLDLRQCGDSSDRVRFRYDIDSVVRFHQNAKRSSEHAMPAADDEPDGLSAGFNLR
jgi:hypothetical protein